MVHPFFSVIIPTYNRSECLSTAILSVLQQKFEDFEIIIVDDGSTDNTEAVVRAFDDSRIKYVFQENKELSASRNKGAREASGRFVCYLDDDDEYLEQHLQILHHEIIANKKTGVIYRTGLITRSRSTEIPGILWNGRTDKIKFIWDNFIGNTSFCFPLEVFTKYRFPEEFILFEDKHFLMRVFLKYDLIQIQSHTVIYNYNDESRSNTAYRDDERLKNQSACLEDLFSTHGNDLIQILGQHAKRRKLAAFYLQAAYQALRNKDWQYSKRHFRSAISKYSRVDMLKSYLAFLVRYVMKKVL